jgi:penicillin amidase
MKAVVAPLIALALVASVSTLHAQTKVDIQWDTYGVPHVRADTDQGAYYGAGYATARARLFQMHWNRLISDGRTAEFFGPGANDRNVTEDRKARQIGWSRHAENVIRALPAEERALLESFASGVNAYVASRGARLHPLFARYGIPVERWTAADCVKVWTRLARHFANFAKQEASKRHAVDTLLAQGKPREEILVAVYGSGMVINRHAVVKESDVRPNVRSAMAAFARRVGMPTDVSYTLGTYTPHFSQAAAVSGRRVASGRAVLLGEPRVHVRAPNMFFEWHMVGATFDVRGMGIPGSPNVLVGSTPHTAWSATALGLDQADLFRLETSPTQPNRYRLDGRWLDFSNVTTETIKVRGGADRTLTYRETYWGPVVGEPVIGDVRAGEVYSVKAVPHAIPAQDSVRGFLAMYRAQSIHTFARALEGWTYPSANVVFAGAKGSVGYTAVGAVPIRKANTPLAGAVAQDGNTKANDWQTYLPHALRPRVIDPAAGHVYSANHLPIGTWYPMKGLFPGVGAGARARRWGELLASKRMFSEADVARFHLDRVNPNSRDLVRLALAMRRLGMTFSARATQALRVLEPWLNSGATLDATHGGVAVASKLRGTLRRLPDGDAVVETWGAGSAGLSNFLEERLRGLRASPTAVPTRAEGQVVEGFLKDAYNALIAQDASLNNAPPSRLLAHYVSNDLTGAMAQWTALGQPEPLVQTSIPYGPLVAAHLETNLSQNGDSYTQLVVVGVPDGARSMLAFGQSEHDASPHARDQQRLWESGALKGSPTTAAGVNRLGVTDSITLTLP